MTKDTKLLGRRGEDAAAKHLAQTGYTVIARNHRTPFGEVDLIASHGEFIVFVEVKTRRNRTYGLPEEAITASKKKRLLASAQHFLQQRDLPNTPWRIDVVAVEYDRSGRLERIEVFENAVSA
jgi:putative endonuclease